MCGISLIVPNDRKLYAAYGSNMNVEQMRLRAKNVCMVGRGYIVDYELEFRRYANIKKSKGQRVPVVLWTITEDDEEKLDRYEGVDKGIYRKEMMKVVIIDLVSVDSFSKESNNDIETEAMVYLMNSNNARNEQFPPWPYYNTVLEGYRQNGFAPDPLVIAAIKAGCKMA